LNVPSCRVRADESIAVLDAAKEDLRVKAAAEDAGQRGLPEWLDMGLTTFQGIFRELPARDQLDPNIREQLIVELYSK